MTKPPGPRELQLRQQREAAYEENQKRMRAAKPPASPKPAKGKKLCRNVAERPRTKS